MNEALIINAAVLTVVLESDLGRRRKVTWFRLVRPFVTALIIVPFFIKGVAFTGGGALLELGGIALGAALGWLTTTQMNVYPSPETGRPVTRAGLGYASIWVLVSAARVLFAYGSDHWFRASLGSWLVDNRISSDALTDSLIFMALAMVLTRVAVVGVRARRLALGPAPDVSREKTGAEGHARPALSGLARGESRALESIAAAAAVVDRRRSARRVARAERRRER